jgi:hypothetical protein
MAVAEDVMNQILMHVSRVGWECAIWSDDNLCSKKLYPGFQFSAKSKAWLPRLRVCEESMLLFVKRVQLKHEQQPAYLLRRKLELSATEALAERAAFIYNVGQELLSIVPVKAELLQQNFYEAWTSGCSQIDTEAQAALMDKAADFDVTKSMPCLRKLIDAHVFTVPVGVTLAETESLAVDRFQLIMKQLRYDVQVYETWQRKCASVESVRESARQEWRLRRRQKCEQAAANFLQTCSRLLVWDEKKAETNVGEAMSFKRELVAKLGCLASEVPSVLFLNYTAPCLIYANHALAHSHLVSWALYDCPSSVALMLGPVFAY